MNRLFFLFISILILITSIIIVHEKNRGNDDIYLEEKLSVSEYFFNHSYELMQQNVELFSDFDRYIFVTQLLDSNLSLSCDANYLTPLQSFACAPSCSGCIENGSAGQEGEPGCYKWTCNDGFCAPIASGCCLPTVSLL